MDDNQSPGERGEESGDTTGPRSTFVTASRLGRFGIGGPASHVAATLLDGFAPARILCYGHGQDAPPASYGVIPEPWRRRRVGRLRLPRGAWLSASAERRRFDETAAGMLEATDLLVVENGTGSACMRSTAGRAARRILLVHNEHPDSMRRALAEEDRRWDVQGNFLDDDLVDRQVEELRAADLVVCFSSFVERSLLAGGVDPGRIRVLTFGVDTARFTPSQGPATERPWRVAFVGWLVTYKGFPYLVEAFRQLADPGAELLLHGGTDVAEMHGLVERLGGNARVRIVQGDVAATLREADVAVQPGISEGFGLAVLEAMASGLPVVVTDHCGAAEVVSDGHDGFVVPAGDAEAITDRLRTLRTDEALRREMGKRARHTAEQHTWADFRTALAATLQGNGPAPSDRPVASETSHGR